jgi:murein DD-endopeptidase MepM/ murein hydrolase activator NlpD
MEDAYTRSRYHRNTAYARRRKKADDKKSMGEILVRQAAICIIILITVVVAKNIDNPLANRAIDNLKQIISHDIEIKGINDFKEILNIKRLFEGTKDVTEEATDDLKDTSVVSAGLFENIDKTMDIEEKIVDKAQNIINKMTIPVQGIIEAPFGEFIHPVSKDVLFHNGIDIAVQKRADIGAAYEGVVIETGSKPEFGNYIILDHGDGIKTVYAHCTYINVVLEQTVKQEEKIASIAGNSMSEKTHLHFEIHVNNQAIDPLKYMSVD